MASNIPEPDINSIIAIMSQLLTNYATIARSWFNIFYNPTPMDVDVEIYDENGELIKYTIPNRAKDFNYIKNGNGSPEGVLVGSAGTTYQDLTDGVLYIKVTQGTSNGWRKVITQEEMDTFFLRGNGSPEGVITRGTGFLYVDTIEGTLYIKETSTGNTGWVAISPNPTARFQETFEAVATTDRVQVQFPIPNKDLITVYFDGYAINPNFYNLATDKKTIIFSNISGLAQPLFSKSFVKSDWVESQGLFTLTVPASEHKQGPVNLIISVRDSNGEEIYTTNTLDENGNFVVTATTSQDGHLLISSLKGGAILQAGTQILVEYFTNVIIASNEQVLEAKGYAEDAKEYRDEVLAVQIHTLNVGTTENLQEGESAYVVNVGTATEQVWNFGIPRGLLGPQGISAYQVAVINGFVGTETEWLASLVGPVFTPNVSTEGVLSWTNNGGLINPPNTSIRGPQGVQGGSGEVAVGTTTTLPAGSTAKVTNTGTPTSAILNFEIPQGERGTSFAPIGQVSTVNDLPTSAPIGTSYFVGTASPYNVYSFISTVTTPSGEWYNIGIIEGPIGPKGDSATIAIGTTTTLPTGESATVTNTGTESASVLNFGLPKGDTGIQGPKGDDSLIIVTDITSTTITETLSDNTFYQYGTLSSLTLSYPSGNFTSVLSFYSGNTATTINIPSSTLWAIEAPTIGVSTSYRMSFEYDGINVKATCVAFV